MSVTADDPRPPKVQVAAILRDEITSGSIAPGQRLDSVRALAERFNIASQTVTNALKILIDEGLIRSVPNRGYYVQTATDEPQGPPEYRAIVKRLDEVSEAVRLLTDRVAELEGTVRHGRK
ncbi:GntR family transcriptional regulator [Streptomyces sp. 8N616]|uniref:GntR family transcriptional regulator n=1 Tax=Streptomyces sp. 8N616 TaxID=3457414 RepID=UPI003FCF9DD1